MIVGCPKCKTKLKVADEKIAPEGTRFKCPQCNAVLLVKRPSVQIKLVSDKILVAHANSGIVERIAAVLRRHNYKVITSQDGIDAMIKTLKELPFLAIIDVALPKIYGFEICKKLKERTETKDIKVILISSIYDKTRYRREPTSLYGAEGYIEEHEIETSLIEKINALNGIKETAAPPPEQPVKEEQSASDSEFDFSFGQEAPAQKSETLVEQESPVQPEIPAKKEVAPVADEAVEKARRLARTIVSDIYLYSSTKMENSIRNNTFDDDFAPELREGTKLYEGRISQDVRSKGDFFREAIDNFIREKKKTLKT